MASVSYLRAHDFMHFSYEKSHGGGEKGVVDEKVRKIDKIRCAEGTEKIKFSIFIYRSVIG
jgi:hypothetical protein